MGVRIVIAGDVVIPSLVITDDGKNIIDTSLQKIIQDVDYSVVNLEAPVKTMCSKPILKTGPNISQPERAIDLMKSVGFKCFTLANNHFRDYGDDASLNTIALLKAKGVDYMGGGKDLSEASSILYKNINGINVAFINVCEQEWSIATENRAGSNPVQPLKQYYQILEAKSLADLVILIYHGGVEHYNLPSPELKNLHRFFIDVGVDVVVNHHQHCFSGYEVYNNKPIFYGLGNFIFDRFGEQNSDWNYGYFVELIYDKDQNTISFELHPYEQCNGKYGVFDRVDKDFFYDEIRQLNNIISEDRLLKDCWVNFVVNNRAFYDPAIVPFRSRILNKLYRMKLLPQTMTKFQLCYIYDIINCDSHRIRFIEYLVNKISK